MISLYPNIHTIQGIPVFQSKYKYETLGLPFQCKYVCILNPNCFSLFAALENYGNKSEVLFFFLTCDFFGTHIPTN